MRTMRLELRLSLLYFALATLWIILSDALLAAVAVPEIVSAGQTYKGALFVFVTSLLLFALLSREMGHRRKADRAAREGEMKFSYLFLNNPLPMWIYDLETLAFLDVNQAAIGQYGYSRAEFLNLKITDIRPPEDVPRLMENLAEARPALQRSGLWRHRLKNGQIIYVDIVSYEVRFDGRKAALVVAHNVTESIQARRDLQESSERLKAVFNASPVAIFVFDTEGRIRLSNPAAEQMYGWGAAELIGQRPPFVPPGKIGEFDAWLMGKKSERQPNQQ
ncbi:MAG: PAS domain S-box protein [Chloroflexi bacterium]|nr:PAS domain S-box protein [Chloroflexota bacterium]MDL1882632.1 PAS domain S-box protein [Anaerolineae bacterium CFX8]